MDHITLRFLSGAEFVHHIVYNHAGDTMAVSCSGCLLIFTCPSLREDFQRLTWSATKLPLWSAHFHTRQPCSEDQVKPLVGEEGPSLRRAGSTCSPAFVDPCGRDWVLEGLLEEAHDGPIWSSAWSPTEFRQLLATASEDKCVGIYGKEEKEDGSVGWVCLTKLRDARLAVSQVKFAPARFGLKLAACSHDGLVRVYEAQDEPDLRSWSLVGDQFVSHDGELRGCTAVEWGPNLVPMTLAICGSDGSLKLWSIRDGKWTLMQSATVHGGSVKDVSWCPNLCRPYDLIATCGGGTPPLALWRLDRSSRTFVRSPFTCPATHAHLATAPAPSTPSDAQTPLSMGVSIGRSVSTAMARRGVIGILSDEGGESESEGEKVDAGELFLTCLQVFDLLPSPLWCVAWNTIGTQLAASSDDQVFFFASAESSGFKWGLLSYFQEVSAPASPP